MALCLPAPAAAEVEGSAIAGRIDAVAGDRLDLACTAEAVHTFFLAETFVSDGVEFGSFSAGSAGSDGTFVRIGETDLVIDPPREDGLGLEVEGSFVFEEAAVYRLALAAWGGGPLDCDVAVNGKERPWAVASTFTAHLDGATFPQGVVARADVAEAGGALVYERDSDGYLFAFMVTDVGLVQAVRPDGYRYVAAGGLAWVTIAEETDGLWRYEIDAGAGIGGIHLWLIDAPI